MQDADGHRGRALQCITICMMSIGMMCMRNPYRDKNDVTFVTFHENKPLYHETSPLAFS